MSAKLQTALITRSIRISILKIFMEKEFAQVGQNVRANEVGEITCAKESPCSINMQDVDLWTFLGFTCSNVNGTTNNVFPDPCY